VAWIDDTNVKVLEVVSSKQAYGLSPEDLQAQFSHLSLAQVHAALAYYYDHQQDLDAELRRRADTAAELRARTADPTLQARLHQVKKTWTP
jgi:uncharacterized protein (DUF433 family)